MKNAPSTGPAFTRAFTPLWTKVLPLKLTSEVQYGVVQLGPRFLVLDDQESVLDPSLPPGPGHAWRLRWTDGELKRAQDQTFATIESAEGDRLTPQPDVFVQTAGLESVGSNGAAFLRQQAQVVTSQDRAYAIIVNRAAGLAGVDRKTGRSVFLIPLRLGDGWSLELVDGYPVVRTRFTSSWVVTIHDPATGATLYRDERPRTPGY